ncbi:MAG: ABC transporter substrate-binding protein [Desulfobacterales bacterium]|nr:ABC transporter substrate-binding protein [Desulfobacterales bacterium]
MKYSLTSRILLLILVVSLVSFNGYAADNILRFGLHTSKIKNFDPHYARSSEDFIFADMVFNSLVRYVPGRSPRLEPDIAETIPAFEMVRGKQVWTIRIRKNVIFHRGLNTDSYELTADDVVYSFQKAADPKRSAFFGEYAGMTFKKIDTYTVQIIVNEPISPLFFLPRIANRKGGFIIGKKVIEENGYEQFKSHPLGTGPFKFKRYAEDDKLELSANTRYFRGTPKLSGVEVHFIPDNMKREAAYNEGRMDIIIGVGNPGWFEMMEKDPTTIHDVYGVGYTGLFHFNTSIKPLDDIRVRKAITYALDQDAFLEASSKRIMENVYAPIPEGLFPGGLSKTKVEKLGLLVSTDLKKAKQLLEEAGFPNGFDLKVISSEKRVHHKVYDILKEQLARVGVRVQVEKVPHKQMHKMIRQNISPIVLYFTIRPNADVYLRGFFHSDSRVVIGSRPNTNFSQYDKVDNLIDDARAAIDPQKQIALWEQVQIRIMSDAVIYPVFIVKQSCTRRDYVNYGHELINTLAGYPQFNEKTSKLQQ